MSQIVQFPVVLASRNEAREEVGPLYPVPLRLFKAGQALPCALYRQDPANCGAPKVSGWRRCGQAFTSPGDESAWGYFRLGDAGPLLAHLAGRLEEGEADRGAALERTRFLYDLAVVWTQHVFGGAPGTLTPEHLRLAQVLTARLHLLLSDAAHPREVILAVRRHDSGLFTHSVNVALMGLAFVGYLGWPEPEAQTFGLGALLHDIGMASLSPDTWNKTAPLSPAEQEDIRTHPQRSVQLLEGFPALAGEVFLMAAQHHEGGDGSGYPLGLPERAIHPWARLLRLVDTFEAMTSIRAWRAPLNPSRALKVLRHTAGDGSPQPNLLADFGRFWGSDGTAVNAVSQSIADCRRPHLLD